MVAGASTALARASAEGLTKKWAGIVVSVLVCLGVMALPTPAGLSRQAQCVLAITGMAVVLWIFQSINNGVVSILMMGLMILAGVRVPLALSGFASPSFWVLLCVLFYGFAMQRTGLAQRVSYYILSVFPATYAGINCAFFLIGLVLALGVPSITVRTAIMAPIAWALVKGLDIAPRSRGAALIMVTTVEMAVLPGCAFLYSSLYGPVIEAMFRVKNLPLSWTAYARVITAPMLTLCVLLLVANQLVMRPEASLRVSNRFARERLRALGAMQRDELITAVVVIGSIAFWVTDRWHHLPSFWVGMIALAVFAVAGIVRDEHLGTGVSWTMLLFMGGIFSLSGILQESKVTDWLANLMLPVLQQFLFSTVILLVVVALITFLVRFLDPSSQIAVPVLFLSMCGVTTAAGVTPLALTGILLIAATPFWLSYENIWLVMAENATDNEAFTGAQRLRLANAYAVVTLMATVLAVGYWKLIHVL